MTLIDTVVGFAATLDALGAELGVEFPTSDMTSKLGPPLDMLLGPHLAPGEIETAADRFREIFCADVPAIAQSGKGTGSIEVSLEPTDIVSDEITWFDADDQNVGSGSYIVELLPGEYVAQVVTSKGCTAEGPSIVDTEIMSYNLVTQNNDGKNDRFVVDCLSYFPNNNVKIFNRSGVLVYEGDYYDNINTFFDGIGKNGIYMTGNVLPVGTYFYIIDKGDGSKPRTGYLELVR